MMSELIVVMVQVVGQILLIGDVRNVLLVVLNVQDL